MTDAREISWLLEDLCVNQGFCLPRDVQEQLVASPPPTPEAFATAVVLAEGLDPLLEKRLYQSVLDTVQKAFQRTAGRDT